MKKMEEIKPVKINHARVIWKLIKEKSRYSKKKNPFGADPTEYFRKLRRATKVRIAS